MPNPTPAPVRTIRRADEEHPSGDPRFALIDRTLKRFQYQQDALIEVLHTAQEAFGFLSDDLLIYVARQLKSRLAIGQQGSSYPALLRIVLQVSVDRAQADIRIFFPNPAIDFLSSHQLPAGLQRVEDCLFL